MLIKGEWIDDIFKQEVPAGAVNAINKDYTLSKWPHSEDGTLVFVNAIPQQLGIDFTISGKVITLTNAPVEGQRVFAWYIKGEL